MRTGAQGIMKGENSELPKLRRDYELLTAGENLKTFNEGENTVLLSMGLMMTLGLPSRGTTSLPTGGGQYPSLHSGVSGLD